MPYWIAKLQALPSRYCFMDCARSFWSGLMLFRALLLLLLPTSELLSTALMGLEPASARAQSHRALSQATGPRARDVG